MKSISKIILALMLLVSSASAQTLTQQGTIELGGDISYTEQTSVTTVFGNATQSVFSANPYFGVMAVRGLELGIKPGVSDVLNSSSTTIYSPTGFPTPERETIFNLFFAPSYNINTNGNAVPYFEFLIGYSSDKVEGSAASTGLGLGGEAGVKILVSGRALLLFKVQYLHQNYNNEEIVDPYSNFYNNPISTNLSLNIVSFGVGFRIYTSPSAKTNVPAEIKK